MEMKAINFRMTKEEVNTVDKAAELDKRSRANFIQKHIVECAKKINDGCQNATV